ncbi:hypothetical protein DYB35_008779 [Aphanomyces astaci]|uniref:B30.2/SPRY domain-containing protein n=1 Tax=Aphanomyces astaci TaxID=112090 RepID=A0A418D1H9_APHAT|nr:hypothetical protein DYB35_008779 [Aphanomyces astaci]
MWVATPFGLAALTTTEAWESLPKVTVKFPWGIGYLQRRIVSTSHAFQVTCFALPRPLERFTLTVELTVSFATLRERILRHLDMPLLLVDNVVVMQPFFGGPDDYRLSPPTPGQLVFTSLRPLLVTIFPTIKLTKCSSLLHIEASDKETAQAIPPTAPSAPSTEHHPTTPPIHVNPRDKLSSTTNNRRAAAAAAAATLEDPTTLVSPVVTQIGRGIGCVTGAEGRLTSGRKYWEVRLDTTLLGDGVFVGVATVDVPLNSTVVGTDTFWGFAVHLGKKVSVTLEPYGGPEAVCVQGDVVGTLYDAELGLLSFYRNGRPLGPAFRHLYFRGFCPAFATTNVGLRFTLLPGTVPPLTAELS